ncbi:MAG TPA: MraY family glycosyltransferase [Solirubrobacteraceae bacterium]
MSGYQRDAVLAFAVAAVAAWAFTPVTGRLARALGAVDQPSDRGLSDRPTPRLGGIAILAAGVLAGLIWLPAQSGLVHPHPVFTGILGGAVIITVVGAIDDLVDLNPLLKLIGQTGAALVPVLSGVAVQNFTAPFLGHVDLGGAADPVTVLALIVVMNVVNFSDGVDGLAAGVCAIVAIAFAVIAFDLGKNYAAILAALTAGASLGFLSHNFYPASVFMGDSGSNLLGLVMGCVAIEGTVKTPAVVAVGFPLVLLAVPFLDTTFVILKRLKYRRPVYRADDEHFHHRLARIGFSQRRTAVYIYVWTLLLAGLALAMRFVPYSDHHGHFKLAGSIALAAIGLVVAAASVYLVYVLEILKFRRRLRRLQPETAEHEIDAELTRRLETGEFDAIRAGR